MGDQKKCVLVTGAAGALGSEVARTLHAEGYAVALLDRPESQSRLAATARDLGANVRGVGSDAASAAAWSAALGEIEAELGPITHAALCAGAFQGGEKLHTLADNGSWDAMMSVNGQTVFAALRALLPPMVRRKSGAIVVIGSRVAERPWTGTAASAYVASKSAVVALAEVVAAEVLADGVRVNSVLPSTLDTPSNRRSMPAADPRDWVSLASAAGVISFLLSERARDISGASIPLYGRA
jgi:NAD(P)-dependent dehydrogenase (short-subunit alcohol dehydrogenase family)